MMYKNNFDSMSQNGISPVIEITTYVLVVHY